MREADKTMILVQTKFESLVSCKERAECDEEPLRRQDYYVVDLENGKTQFLNSLHCVDGMSMGTLLSSGDSVYLLGGVIDQSGSLAPKLRSFMINNRTLNFYAGAARLKLESNANEDCKLSKAEWVRSRMLLLLGSHCNSTVLDGKIYTFGFPSLDPLVFDPDPAVDSWEFIDHPFPVNAKVLPSLSVLPDPQNNRIFLLLSHRKPNLLDSLYHFKPKTDDHPSHGDWTLVQENFVCWSDVAAVADDLIFFHYPGYKDLVRPFDVRTLRFLPVRWSDNLSVPGWDLPHYSRLAFDKLLRLSDTSLCLAISRTVKPRPADGSITLALTFFKFTFERDGEFVILSPKLLQKFTIPHCASAEGMVPIL